MIETTLIFLFDSKDNILLSMKKRGFGVGKRNGAGGKLHPGETILQAALRELEEEVGVQLSPKELKYKGRLHFSRENIPNNDNICSVFFANYEGEVKESEEMKPQRFPKNQIPFDEMWEDDKFRLPEMLSQKENITNEYQFLFDENNKLKERKRK